MSQQVQEIKYEIVKVSTIPSISRGTNQKYDKVVEAARKLVIGESIKIPLTSSKGETNTNASQTLKNHVKAFPTIQGKVKNEETKKMETYNYKMIVSTRNLGTKDKPNFCAFIYYEMVEPQTPEVSATSETAPTPSTA